MNSDYEALRQKALWHIVENALNDLVENGDLHLKTRQELVVGYLCKTLTEHLKKGLEV